MVGNKVPSGCTTGLEPAMAIAQGHNLAGYLLPDYAHHVKELKRKRDLVFD